MRNPILVIVLIILFSLHLTAAPWTGQIKKMKQPDGTLVDVRLFGTEFYMRAESVDGYTLIREQKSKWICYAQVSIEGSELLSTSVHYLGEAINPNKIDLLKAIVPHLDISEWARTKKIKENSLALSGGIVAHLEQPGHPHAHGTPIIPLSGEIKGLTLLIDFSDEPTSLPVSEFEAFCNSLTYTSFGNKGSLRSYYKDISGNKLDYTNAVFGFYRAPHTFAHYDSLPIGTGAHQILDEALHWLENQGFDFSTLTLNDDNTIQAINMMYTGEPPVWAQGMWHHKGTYTGFVSASSIGSKDYNCSPANSPLGIGVVAHENGHMIGKWPDTYKYGTDTGPDGIGAFDLMCWYGNDQNPVPPNPLFRSNAGWGKVIDVSNWNAVISDTANSSTTFQYRNPSDSSEFYLFEARQIIGRSQFIPDAGLTVWHIDRNGNNQSRHHEVKLVTASNDSAEVDQACFRLFYKSEFSAGTTPNSNWYNGDPSGLRLWSISQRRPVMTYNIGAGAPSSNLKMKYAGLSSDPNQNGFPEPGETLMVNWELKNVGQLSSGNLNLQISSIGTQASLVTIPNPIQQLDSMNVNEVATAVFPITISSSAQYGDEITLKLQVMDGSQSIFITKTIVLGILINMNEEEDSTCQALFFDPNGNRDYDNYSHLVKAIYPKGSTNKLRIQFTEFNLEAHANCVYDYLRIFNGPTQTSSIIGTWCGTDSPGTITSTHSTGALTFLFHSDDGVTKSGWKAKLSCFSPTGTGTISAPGFPEFYPNPSNKTVYSLPAAEDVMVKMIDLGGREMGSYSFSAGEKMEFDVSSKPPGIYSLRMWIREFQIVRKFVRYP